MRDSVPIRAYICLTLPNGNRIHLSREHVVAFGPTATHEDGTHSAVTVAGVGDIPVRESVGAIVAALHPTTIAYGPLESPNEVEVDQATIDAAFEAQIGSEG
jgi:hypothetical protein